VRHDGETGRLGEAAIFFVSEMPPTFVMLGCGVWAARWGMISRNPNAVDSFSPSAIGVSVDAATRARPS
jgi:hypothetical protein